MRIPDFKLDDARAQIPKSQINGLDHTNCKETCDTNNCNTAPINKRKQCYTCSGVIDSAGNVVGTGNADCWNYVSDWMLQDCPNDSDWCEDEIIADWLLKGQQIYQIRRGCKSTPAAGPCYEGDTGRVKFKDCAASCFESGCNKDTEAVGNKAGFARNSRKSLESALGTKTHDKTKI